MNKTLVEINHVLTKRPYVGFFASGGFDSTILLYTASLVISKTTHNKEVTVYTVPRFDDSVVHVKRVLSWLKLKFPEITYTTKLTGDPNVHHSQQVASGISQVLEGDKEILLILADTDIPKELIENSPIRIKTKYRQIWQPFINYTKNFTIQLAKELNVLNEVAQISHTCTESKSLRCGKCWQCRERAWGFKSANLIDVGTM